MTGKCKWFSKEKGYGFISGDDGIDYFVHFTQIMAPNKLLFEGEAVKFVENDTLRGLQAVNVEVVT